MRTFKVTANNEFHEGWIAYVLGQNVTKGCSPSFKEGWSMAAETFASERFGVCVVIPKMLENKQLSVLVEKTP